MPSVLPIYIVTAALSIGIGMLLVHMARLSGQAKVRTEKRHKSGRSSFDMAPDGHLKQAILEEIGGLEGPKQRSREITEKIANVFSDELKKKVDEKNRELSKKYKSLIQTKSQNEEIAWKKYKKVLAGKRETEAVIRSIAEGLVVIGPQGKVVMMNPAAEKLLGASKKDKIGKPILENLKKEQLVSLAKDNTGGEGKEIEIMSREDETKKILRSSSAVIENENGQTVGMVSVLSDITKQKELDQMKSDFLSKVSHELRTPIVTVQNSLSLLLGRTTGPLNESQEKFLDIARRNLKRLGLLIDDLLDISKLEASKAKLELAPSSIEKAIDEVCATLVAWAGTKNIKIEKRIQKDISEINFDFNKVIQVLNNIMGNAVKFTPNNGTITVEAGMGEGRKNIFVSVKDTGIGIAKEDLGKVFNKFQQVGERAATDISGTGLGLSIAKEIIELHGGKIWAESEEKMGTKFIFTLPITVS